MKDIALAEYLKNKRSSSGLTQGAVATKLGYSSAQFVSNWERGLSLPPIQTLKKLCVLYKVNQDEMYNHLVDYSVTELKADLHKKFYKKGKK